MGLLGPLSGTPPKWEKGRGRGLSKASATVRCFNDAAKNIGEAWYNENETFGTEREGCKVLSCVP